MSVIRRYKLLGKSASSDITSGRVQLDRFSKRLVMANHIHTWWYNLGPLSIIIYYMESRHPPWSSGLYFQHIYKRIKWKYRTPNLKYRVLQVVVELVLKLGVQLLPTNQEHLAVLLYLALPLVPVGERQV